MTKHLCGSLCECLKMSLYIRKQECEIAAVMIMCHDPSRDAPEPFDAVGIGIIGGGLDQIQVILLLREHAAHEQRSSRRVRFVIFRHHESDATAPDIARHCYAHFGTSHNNCPF